MSFDDIPGNEERAEQCKCGGTIKESSDGIWECDTCDWDSETERKQREAEEHFKELLKPCCEKEDRQWGWCKNCGAPPF